MINDKFIPIVLCAGFGTRLKPITDYIPKVICPIIDIPLAFFSIQKFLDAGFEKVYCNTHYKAEMVENELKASAKEFGYDPNRIIFIYEKEILGSGGGIFNIVEQIKLKNPNVSSKDLFVVSGDVVADFPVQDVINAWNQKQKSEMALMLSVPLEQDRDDVLCVSEDGKTVVGFGKKYIEANPDAKVQKRMFSNHQIISSELLKNKKIEFISSVDLFYKPILNQNKNIAHMNYPTNAFWFNVGDVSEYQKCLKFFCKQRNLDYPPENKMHFDHMLKQKTFSELFS